MKRELHLSITETVVAVIALLAATAAAYSGNISGDALVALYGSVLGYVFGRVRNGTETLTGKSPQNLTPGNVAASQSPSAVVVGNPEQSSGHIVPGTSTDK